MSMLNDVHCRLFKAEHLRIDRRWDMPNVQSAYWRFYANDRDGASLLLPGSTYPLHGGRLYFVPAGVHFSCHNTQPVGHTYCHFDVIGLPGIALRELFNLPLCLPPLPALESEARTVRDELQAQTPPSLALHCRIKALLFAGLAHYLETISPEQLARCGAKAAALEPVLPALQQMETQCAQPVTNRQLAALCCLSEDYFIRRFRECVGQTPTQYLLERRVLLAAQQLLFTPHSIERIADDCGFGSRAYFARVFARHTGSPPAAYRKASRV